MGGLMTSKKDNAYLVKGKHYQRTKGENAQKMRVFSA